MASLSFKQCDCGIKLKIVQEQDGQRLRYACICGRHIEFYGSVVQLHFTAGAAQFFSPTLWQEVPDSRLQKLN
jgi:hypothetical protein